MKIKGRPIDMDKEHYQTIDISPEELRSQLTAGEIREIVNPKPKECGHKCLGCGAWLPTMWLPSFCRECLNNPKPQIGRLDEFIKVTESENCSSYLPAFTALGKNLERIIKKINELIDRFNHLTRGKG